MKHLIYILVLLSSFNGFSQEVFVKGKVLDRETKDPVQNVKVFFSERPKMYALTNGKGVFVLSVKEDTREPLIFQHVGFQKKELLLDKKMWRRLDGDTLYVNVQLDYVEFETVVIHAKELPKVVFGSERISVNDYRVDKDRLLLLAYETTLRKDPRVVITDLKQNIIKESRLPYQCKEFYTDYRGRHYGVGDETVKRVSVLYDNLYLQDMETEDFYNYLYPIIDTLGERLYFSNYNEKYPSFDYYVYNKMITPKDSAYKVLTTVEDKFMMELYRSEFKYVDEREKLWAFRQEIKTGVDKEIWIGAKYFTNSLYYDAPYAPLFVVEDTVYVFNHYTDRIYKFNDDDELVDSVIIQYHKKNHSSEDWKEPLIMDYETEKIYTIFARGPYTLLYEIDLITGEVGNPFQLTYKYPENISIHNGEVYYIYRPFESIQKKYLYKERLE